MATHNKQAHANQLLNVRALAKIINYESSSARAFIRAFVALEHSLSDRRGLY